jgi:hypothetical protein
VKVIKMELTPEMMEDRTMPMDIKLPGYVWLVLAQLAKETGQTLEALFQSIFERGVEAGTIAAAVVEKRRGDDKG